MLLFHLSLFLKTVSVFLLCFTQKYFSSLSLWFPFEFYPFFATLSLSLSLRSFSKCAKKENSIWNSIRGFLCWCLFEAHLHLNNLSLSHTHFLPYTHTHIHARKQRERAFLSLTQTLTHSRSFLIWIEEEILWYACCAFYWTHVCKRKQFCGATLRRRNQIKIRCF